MFVSTRLCLPITKILMWPGEIKSFAPQARRKKKTAGFTVTFTDGDELWSLEKVKPGVGVRHFVYCFE